MDLNIAPLIFGGNVFDTAPIASATNEAQLAEITQSAGINVAEEDIDTLNKSGDNNT